MNDDVRKYIYGTLFVFIVGVVTWIAFIYVNACGFTVTCKRGALTVYRTPIPTLIPATLPAIETGKGEAVISDHCRVVAADLIGAWVSAGSPESESFEFTDASGRNCASTFEEVMPLFMEANLWYPGPLSCVSCHSVDLAISPAQLDLGSYAGITSGSRRADSASDGTDILGDGRWESSLLFQYLAEGKADVPGHTEALSDLVIFAGRPLPQLSGAETPIPSDSSTATVTP